ncbi:hypothetical protein [Parvularcula dongshanensis]|uniref:Uncharacterized protein n=1 Tax=Parvularcula dongshanensis TaxID=1173995 RepID=A0A840I3F3_9PROT|nr:hypothetical protein [Parvularcula dongshanensis]MBB4658803.1 hypothetical protein [Parvularcula dongshanensis]
MNEADQSAPKKRSPGDGRTLEEPPIEEILRTIRRILAEEDKADLDRLPEGPVWTP